MKIFAFCWIFDYPMFEIDESNGKIRFSHNPFSMPQGNLEELNYDKPLEMKAYQYDIVLMVQNYHLELLEIINQI